MDRWEINGHELEYLDDIHCYIVDGIILPSVTSIIRKPDKYRNVSPAVLKRAADKGTAVHEAIERWCKTGEESDLTELRNFKFLKDKYGFDVLENEVPVIIFRDDEPVAAGRLDLVLQMGGRLVGADIKRTCTLDKEYIAAQLNLYRIGYMQSYGDEWDELRAVHLRDDVRRFVKIPINESAAYELLDDFLRSDNG